MLAPGLLTSFTTGGSNSSEIALNILLPPLKVGETGLRPNMKKKAKNPEQLSDALKWFDQRYNEQQFDLFKRNLSCRTFKYPVDGHLVNGFVIKPKNYHKDLPVLIYNRGGNGDFGKVVFGSMMRNLFPVAQEGFIIIGSQYRGTANENSKVQDQFGGEDVNDVKALFGYIANIKGSDPQRLGMFGASRGGMQTFLTLKQTPYVKAVATIAGPSDLQAMLEKRPRMENVYKRRIPNYTENKQAELDKRSVLKWVDELPKEVPILLLHGTHDKRVAVEQSIALAEALSTAKMPHKLVLYPEDNHSLAQNRHKSESGTSTVVQKIPLSIFLSSLAILLNGFDLLPQCLCFSRQH